MGSVGAVGTTKIYWRERKHIDGHRIITRIFRNQSEWPVAIAQN